MNDTLETRLQMPLQRALELICRLLIALDALHRKGEQHGLIAPGNIRLDAEGRPSLIQFEEAERLGRALRETPEAPLPPELLAYLAPEAQEAPTGPSGDLYGLGRLLFVLLTGEAPQPGDQLSELAPQAGPAAVRLFERCYTRQARRYPTARAAIEDLLGAEAGEGEALLGPLAEALGALGVLSDEDTPSAEAVAEMTALLQRMNAELRALPDLGRALIPLVGIGLAIGLWPYFYWMSLGAIPLAIMLRMVRGDLKQKRLFLGPMLEQIAALCESSKIPRLFVWRLVDENPESYSQIWVWMQYAEPFFLPEPLRSAPRRMGGVSKVPWS